jgi:20S proteasome subunit alpha 3
VEFATIQLENEKVKYNLYKPEEINSLLKEQNVGGNATE